MLKIQNELNSLLQRTRDRQLRVAVTGLSRSGKTAFITSLVNQLLQIQQNARLPLISAVHQQRVLGARRVLQRDLASARFEYDQSLEKLFSRPPRWPDPTRGVSQIRLRIKFRSKQPLRRYLSSESFIDLELIDYPGEWLLDLPMLGLDYSQWSTQQTQRLTAEHANWSDSWQRACQNLDPASQADETQLAHIAQTWTDYLVHCQQNGLSLIQPGRFVLPGELAGAPVLQFFPFPIALSQAEQTTLLADKSSTYAVLAQRYHYYCQHIVKRFYKEHFASFDRQVVLVDVLQALNNGALAFNDMRQALTQIMQSFNYGQRTLLRRLFSPVIDKLLFAATKADHITPDQQPALVELLKQLVQPVQQTAAYEGIATDFQAIASVEATQYGKIPGQNISVIRGDRLTDGKPLTLYPGDVPRRLPNPDFWQQQGFQFENFRPLIMDPDQPLPHIQLDNVLEFLLGDKLK